VESRLKLAGVGSTDTLYDLGCGDGRVAIAAAKNYGTHGVGVDIDPLRLAEARENAKKTGVKGLVRFEEGQLLEADMGSATVVTVYLLPEINMQVRSKLLSELKAKGYRIVHMVPGPGNGPTVPAPKGWFSETERVINALRPRFEKSAAPFGDGPFPVRPAPNE